MGNPIRLGIDNNFQTSAFRSGNFMMGINGNFGPTSGTGFYTGVDVPASGYTVYYTDDSQSDGMNVMVYPNDATLIGQKNVYRGTGETVSEILYSISTGNSNTVILNLNYPQVITSGCVTTYDSGFIPSYPRTGTTFFDISSGNTGTNFGYDYDLWYSGGVFYNTSGYTELTTFPSVKPSFTLDVIFAMRKRPTNSLVEPNRFYISNIGNKTTTGFGLFATDKNIQFVSNTSPSTSIITDNLELGQVYFLTATYEELGAQNVMSLYSSGTFISSATTVALTQPTTNKLIGAEEKLPLSGAPMNLYSHRFYNRRLSASEILQNYNQLSPRYIDNTSYPLDVTYSGATVAYSLRKLKKTASLAIQVIRATDGQVSNIGFDLNGNLDQECLLEFCRSTDCRVLRWYDQSGNGYDASQFNSNLGIYPVVPNAPFIVTGGTVNLLNGKPAIKFNGANALIGGPITGATEGISATDANGLFFNFVVANVDVHNAVTNSVIFSTDNAAARISQNLRVTLTPTTLECIGFNTANTPGTDANATNVGTSAFLGYTQRTAANIELYINNATNGATAIAGTPQRQGATTSCTTAIGVFNAQTLANALNGNIQEIILYGWNPATKAYRTGLSANINAYYTIY